MFQVSINSTSEEVRSTGNPDVPETLGEVSINSTSEEVRSWLAQALKASAMEFPLIQLPRKSEGEGRNRPQA